MMRFCVYVLGLMLLCGCDVHQWPESWEPEPEPGQFGMATLRLHYEPDMQVWNHLYDPKLNEIEEVGLAGEYTNVVSSGVMDIFVNVYRHGNTEKSVAEYTFTHDVTDGYDCELELPLPLGTYEVAVWSHLRKHGEAPHFYEPNNFRGIYIISNNYDGNTNYRDAFRGRADLDLMTVTNTGPATVYDVEMHRPMGKFELVTIDLSEFLDHETERRHLMTRANAEDYRVVISYPNYYPNGYNLLSDDISAGSGYQFETRMIVTGESEASMGFDYVFIRKGVQVPVQVRVQVYDFNGNIVASTQVIDIPIQRDHHTVLRGAFLSMNTGGGVGINPDYDGDHNVVFH